MQRAPAALLLQPHHADVVELGGEFGGDPGRVVDAGVVGDRDARREREVLLQVAVQAVDRIGEVRLRSLYTGTTTSSTGTPAARAASAAFGRDAKSDRGDPQSASRSRAMSVMTSMVG